MYLSILLWSIQIVQSILYIVTGFNVHINCKYKVHLFYEVFMKFICVSDHVQNTLISTRKDACTSFSY